MAAVLESVTVLRPCGSRMALSAPATAASVSALSTNRKVSALPEFRGLKVQSPYPRRTLASVSSEGRRNLTRSGGIVCEAQETAVEDAVPAVNDATWKSLVIEADLPVLVEFWAPWCGPCRMIHPVINEVSQLYAGKLKCFKLNTDESPSVATEYGIRSIPTVIIFKNGEKKDAVVGAVPKKTLTDSIEKFL